MSLWNRILDLKIIEIHQIASAFMATKPYNQGKLTKFLENKSWKKIKTLKRKMINIWQGTILKKRNKLTISSIYIVYKHNPMHIVHAMYGLIWRPGRLRATLKYAGIKKWRPLWWNITIHFQRGYTRNTKFKEAPHVDRRVARNEMWGGGRFINSKENKATSWPGKRVFFMFFNWYY